MTAAMTAAAMTAAAMTAAASGCITGRCKRQGANYHQDHRKDLK
jgi:hypothetical protein